MPLAVLLKTDYFKHKVIFNFQNKRGISKKLPEIPKQLPEIPKKVPDYPKKMRDNYQACFLEYFLRSQKTYLTISLQKSIDQLDDCQAAFWGRQASFFRVQKEVKTR